MQLLSGVLTLDFKLDWPGLNGTATPVTPPGLGGLLPGVLEEPIFSFLSLFAFYQNLLLSDTNFLLI